MKVKKVLSLCVVLATLGLAACNGGASSEEPASSVAPAPSSQAASSVAPTPSSQAASSVAPASSAAPVSSVTPASKNHNWVAGTTVKNSDDKDCINYSCSDDGCDAVKVEIAIKDASSGAGDIGSDGKLGKGKTFVWKIVAPKAGNVTLQFFIKYGQTGDSLTDSVRNTYWGNYQGGPGDYIVKNGDTAANVLVNSTVTYEESGVTADGAYVNFATFAVTQGENAISLTTPADQYYRNCFINNVAIVF